MTAGHTIKRRTPTSEPDVDQGIHYGWPISWNPDDGKFYVGGIGNRRARVFARWSNAVQYARTHKEG